jgi:Cof subfamily protein (haloacid dehalogenase superfamily)
MKKNKKYRALMLDLDGTTIPNRRDGMPSKKVIEAVAKAKKKLHVGVVTGRPYYVAEHVVRELGLNGPSIIAGGAEVRVAETGDILWSKTIASQTTKEILQYFIQKGLKVFISDDEYYKNEKFFDPKNPPKAPLLISIPDMSLSTSEKVIKELSQFTDIVVHKLVGWEPNTIWLQIAHAEASKQYGIFEVAKILGIETHEIIGVGDGYNDFPLLMACGLRVAMGNAVAELKEIADYIAPSVAEDGVVDVIERFVLGDGKGL